MIGHGHSHNSLAEPLMAGGGAPPPPAEDHRRKDKRKLLVGVAMCATFMLTEIVGGLLASSLAIITDAAHMLSDVAGFLVGVLSLVLTARAANSNYTFGYHRAEVLGALVSIMIVWLMTGVLLWEAVRRLFVPEIVDGPLMFWVSFAGVIMNIVLMQVRNSARFCAILRSH